MGPKRKRINNSEEFEDTLAEEDSRFHVKNFQSLVRSDANDVGLQRSCLDYLPIGKQQTSRKKSFQRYSKCIICDEDANGGDVVICHVENCGTVTHYDCISESLKILEKRYPGHISFCHGCSLAQLKRKEMIMFTHDHSFKMQDIVDLPHFRIVGALRFSSEIELNDLTKIASTIVQRNWENEEEALRLLEKYARNDV